MDLNDKESKTKNEPTGDKKSLLEKGTFTKINC